MDAPTGTPLWLAVTVPVLGIIVVPLALFFLKQNKRLDLLEPTVAPLAARLDAVEELASTHEVALFGAHGDNGINSEVRKLRGERHDLRSLAMKHEARIDTLEDRADRKDNQK